MLVNATALHLIRLPVVDPIATCYAGCRGICDCPTYRHL